MLLPAKETEEEEAEDPRAELVEQLLEYKIYKCISNELKDRQMDAEKVMFKEPTIPDEVAAYEEPVDLEELMADVTLKKLNDILKSIMRKQEDKIDPVRSKFGKIEKEEVSLSDKMVYLEQYAMTHPHFIDQIIFHQFAYCMVAGYATDFFNLRLGDRLLISKLVEYNLVNEVGRLDAPGRPMLFGTTEEFLRSFGVHSIDELPMLNEDQVEEFKHQAEQEAEMKLEV